MKNKHTPGPWNATDRENRIASLDGTPIARVYAHTSDGRPSNVEPFTEEDEANAKLIAAAPDLLATLEAIKARINGEFDNPSLIAMGSLSDFNEDVSTWIEAAIAKATE